MPGEAGRPPRAERSREQKERRRRAVFWSPPGRLLAAFVLFLVLPLAACRVPALPVSSGGVDPPPSGSLSVSFIDAGRGDGVLVQAGGRAEVLAYEPP